MKIIVFLHFHLFLTHCANMAAWFDYSLLPAPPPERLSKISHPHVLTFRSATTRAEHEIVRSSRFEKLVCSVPLSPPITGFA